ncbi:hypothetical protein [[Phormidium] sp. ETS-05]|uniref:hypothetical protein n=1 Tax=[Phormidium] sp. ETS-05 TaxID=222819 RepID=UPI0018EEE18B|nr:hypothetical protein [[Phormidium] sp. ETS-05]
MFAYSLRDGGERDNPLWEYGDEILTHFTDENLTSKLVFPPNTPKRADLMRDIALTFNHRDEDKPEIEGFARPVQLQDSYALWLNVGYDDEDTTAEAVAVDVLGQFNPENCLIIPKHDKILGQTLLITGWIAAKTKQQDKEYLKNLADSCCEKLLGDKAPPFYRRGELFGSAIFEYGLVSDIANYQQVMVWLFRDEVADNRYDEYQQEIVDLLFYRCKVIKAFQDSRLIYAGLDKGYGELEQTLEAVQKKIDSLGDACLDKNSLQDFKTELKGLVKKSLPYTRLVRKLEDFGNVIEINLYNYNETLGQIYATLGTDKEELGFLKTFAEQTAPYFQRQIRGDLGYFEHGTDLVGQAIASIRGIVEIDQAQLELDQAGEEKELEKEIEALGVGIAVGAIVASSSGLITDPWRWPTASDRSWYPHPFLGSIVLSLLVAWLSWRGMKRWQNR